MDLWIRSQDKTKLVQIDNICYIDMSDDWDADLHSLWNDCKGTLGTYKSKERCLEILNCIEEHMIKTNGNRVFYMPEE